METAFSFLIAATVAVVTVGIFMAFARWITERREERRIKEIIAWVPATGSKQRRVELRQIGTRAVQWGDGGVPLRAYARDLKVWEWPTGERIVIVGTWIDHAPNQAAVQAAAESIALPPSCLDFRVSDRELIVNVRRVRDRRTALLEVIDWVRAVIDASIAAE